MSTIYWVLRHCPRLTGQLRADHLLKYTYRMRLFILVAIGVSFILPTAAQERTAASLDQVLDAASRAVGSDKDLGAIRSIYAVAACVGPKGKYTTSISSFRNGRTRFEQTFEYRKPTSVFINGDIVWEKNPDTGEFLVSTPAYRMVSRMHEYQKMAIDPRAFFKDLEIIGDEEFNGRPSIKVAAKNELDMPVFLFFDRSNGRLNGYKLMVPGSTETIINTFNEWKPVGKVMLPSAVTAIDSAGRWTLSFHTIKLNSADPKPLEVPPLVRDMIEILRMHEEQKTAHLTYNAEMIVGDSPVRPTTIQRGNVVQRTREEDLNRFKSYFGSFKFLEWEDIQPPIIKVSKDGSMATKIVQKRVRGTSKDKDGNDISEHVVYAWLEVLEKMDGKWRLVTIASTEKDGGK